MKKSSPQEEQRNLTKTTMSEDRENGKLQHMQSWIESEGFALEMRVASVFRSSGFDVRQSIYYSDPETKKAREIDIVASIVSPSGEVDIRLILECKSSKHCWALLCSPDVLDGYDRLRAFGMLSARSRQFLSNLQADMGQKISWIHKTGLIGYSLRQRINKNDRDTGYEASVSLFKACQQHVDSPKAGWSGFFVAFPVIVVDSPLFRCSLGSKGKIEIEEIEQGELFFSAIQPATCIRVVSEKYLRQFVRDAKKVIDYLHGKFHVNDR